MTLSFSGQINHNVFVTMFGAQITADSRKAKEAEEISLARVAEATFRSESAAEEVETLKVNGGFEDILVYLVTHFSLMASEDVISARGVGGSK